jgi:two-component system chemotaxis response regulator CheY
MMKKISIVSIIDDDALFQFTIKKILTATETVDTILQFANGSDAIDYFLENKEHSSRLPDLVLLDLNMPLMNGWQFLEKFNNNNFAKKTITIYICTSSINSKDKEMFKEFSKLNGYILKPLNKNEIYEIIDKELHRTYPLTYS